MANGRVSSYAGDSRGGAGWTGGVERHNGLSNACQGDPHLLDSCGVPTAWPLAKVADRVEADMATRAACTKGCAGRGGPCLDTACPDEDTGCTGEGGQWRV
jgi:hypothetical protein